MIDIVPGDRHPAIESSDRRWTLPELLFASLGGCVVLALFWRCGSDRMAWAAAGLWVAYCVGVIRTHPGDRIRLLVNYLAVWVFYGGSSLAIDALGVPRHEEQLLRWDRALFGESPAVAWQGITPGWINDLLSAGYLSYHLYLHGVLAESLWKPVDWRMAYGRAIFTAFGVGFVGYFVFPAGDPRVVFPELLVSPVEGGHLTQLNHWIVRNFAARYDAFPSLHVLVTSVLLACDWRWKRARVWCMMIPTLGMVASTLLLQLHFAVDLLAGAGLAIGVLYLIRFREIRIDD